MCIMDVSLMSKTKNGLPIIYDSVLNKYKTFCIVHNDHIGFIIGKNAKNINKINSQTTSKILLKDYNIYSNGYKWFYIESSNIYDLMSAYNKLVSIANNAEYKIYRNFLYVQYLKIQKQYYSCNSKIYYTYDTYSPDSPHYSPDSPDYSPDYSPDSQIL